MKNVEGFWQMLSIQMLLFVYMAIGYGLRKGKILKAEARDAFTEFVILVTLPCMIFESFQITLTVETLQKGLLSLFVASSVEVLSLIISNVAFRFCKKMKFLSCATGRWSVTPVLPVCRLLKMGMGWMVFLCQPLYHPYKDSHVECGHQPFTTAPRWERIKRVLFNPGIIAVELGLLRMLFEPDLPLVAVSAIHALGECTTPLAMIIVGMILAEIPLKNFLSGKALLLSAIRQLFMPLVLLLSLRGLHIDPLLTAVATILTGMPIGSTTAILAAKYGANAEFASACVFTSTVTSLVTVPFLALFL